MTNETDNNVKRLNVAMFSDKKTGKPECLQSVTADGIPIWSSARIIDGTLYQLDSTHATMEEATARQDVLRDETSAQAYQSARAKFTPEKGGVYRPAIAAVYKLPFRGAKGLIVKGEPRWPDEPTIRTREEKQPRAKKGAAKTPKKSAKTSKKGVSAKDSVSASNTGMKEKFARLAELKAQKKASKKTEAKTNAAPEASTPQP